MVVLGHDVEQGEPVEAFDLSYGAYLIGTMGMGKSTVLQRMVLDDLEQGHGFILLDPHRQLVETILASVPRDRTSAVAVVDMTDNPPSFGINLFDCIDPTDELALSQTAELFVATFRQALTDTSTAWGALLEGLLYNVAYVMAANPGTGLPDVPRLLRDDGYRMALLARVENEIVHDYWEAEYAALSERSRAREIGSTMRRLRSFITNPLLRQIFGVPKTTIDFRWLMDDGPGLLVALDPNQPHASNLIGAIMLAKIKQHTFARQEGGNDRPFRVYADEFQKFITSDFDRFWGESRKFKVGVIAAHQFRNQLTPELRSASASVGTRLIFAVNHEDAGDLGRMFTLPKVLGEPEFKPVIEDIVEPATMEWYWDPADAPEQIEQCRAELKQLEDVIDKASELREDYLLLFSRDHSWFPSTSRGSLPNWKALSEEDIVELSWLANPIHQAYFDEMTLKDYIRQHGMQRRLSRRKTVPTLPRRGRQISVPLHFADQPLQPQLLKILNYLTTNPRSKYGAPRKISGEKLLGAEFYTEFLRLSHDAWTTTSTVYEAVLPWNKEHDLALVSGELRIIDEHGRILAPRSDRLPRLPPHYGSEPWRDYFYHELIPD